MFEPEITIAEEPFRDKLAGKKIIEYVLIPRKTGNIKIPPIKLIYFDLNEEKWKTKYAKELQLKVNKNERSVSTNIGLSKEEVLLLNEDIRFMNMNTPDWQRVGQPPITLATLTKIVVAIILLILPLTVNFGRSQILATKSNRQARRALKSSLTEIADNTQSPMEIYTSIQESFNKYISMKTGKYIERSNNEFFPIINDIGINENIHDELKRILKNGDTIRYSPITKDSAKMDLVNFKNLLKQIDESWKS